MPLTAHPCGIHQLLAKTVNEIDKGRYGNKFLWSLVWWVAERCQYQAVHTTEVCMSHMFHMVVTLSRLSPQDMLFVWSKTCNHNSSPYTLSQSVEYKPTSVLIALGCTDDAFLKPNVSFLTQILEAM